ncbi:hypothetical protein CDD83_4896 [Cordyceps sp. RAO-2017]|nr:hypothetical protein CDD83_4896 [Cordyceps sp. RAO-2017]
MDGLDGLLLVPPDRTQILGRASWKSRYVVVGKPRPQPTRSRQGSTSFAHGVISGRASGFTPKPVGKPAASSDENCLSVYKAKDDADPIQQWPVACVTDCQVQLVTNRKQGPVLPTLVITVSDKERRRRSSRAAGFISSNKESGSTTLWFRSPADDHYPSLHDWARFILSRKNVLGPESPVSPIFTSPFSSRSYENADQAPRPGSANRLLHHKSSTTTQSTGPRDHPPALGSESPSLRSKRSDISSPSSHNYAPHKMPFAVPQQHYTTIMPATATTSPGEYRGEFIEGWTSAQGRSSTLSSPTRPGRDSLGSQAHQHPIPDATSPPAPGETILDRAFQLGHIPGADIHIPGQENLSSIARFDALMREVEQRRKQKERRL